MDIDWNNDKNELLKKKRNVSFEMIEEAIHNNKVVAIEKHCNSVKYPNQYLMHVLLNNYIHTVPFTINDNVIFLKTIFADRKAHRKYKKAIP